MTQGPVRKRLGTISPTSVLMLALTLSGCANLQAPKPWEKDRLAQPEMQFDADPLDSRTTRHVYDSRESAGGGSSVGGGGCGCN